MTPPFSCALWQPVNPLPPYDSNTCVKDQIMHHHHSQKPLLPPSSTPSINVSIPARVEVKVPSKTPNPIPTLSQRDLMNHELLPLFSQKYRLIQELGTGGFGIVCTAIRLSDNFEVAVKFILKKKVAEHGWIYDEAFRCFVPMEIFVLKSIKHKNIVEYYETFQDDVYYYLVMELHGTPWSPPMVASSSSTHHKAVSDKQPLRNNNNATNKPSHDDATLVEGSTLKLRPGLMPRRPSCDLFECIEQRRRFGEREAKYIFQQIIDVVRYLSLQNIYHRDIKDENILIDKDLNVKLIDFGSAVKVKSSAHKFAKFYGTISYAAPEILNGKEYYPEMAEVWSLGVLLYTILYGDAPFQNPEHACWRPPISPRIQSSPEVLHLLDWMLVKNPKRRARIADIASHPWLHKNGHFVNPKLQVFSNTRPKTNSNIGSK